MVKPTDKALLEMWTNATPERVDRVFNSITTNRKGVSAAPSLHV